VRLAGSSSTRCGFFSITETSQVVTVAGEVDFSTPWCKASVGLNSFCNSIFLRAPISQVIALTSIPTSKLNRFMCGPLHRKGWLCGECEDGFGLALYSYTLECKKCWGHGLGWVLYITLTVIPTTIIYIIVVVFCISATSSSLSAFVLFCHFTVYIFHSQPDLYMLIANESNGFSHGLLKLIPALCGLWSLDIFHPIVPPFFVGPNMKNLPQFPLEYIEAFYPRILILITYICIKLHDQNFRPVVLLWRPFH